MAFRLRCPKCSTVYTAGEDHACRKNVAPKSVQRRVEPASGKDAALGALNAALDEIVSGVPDEEFDKPHTCPTCGQIVKPPPMTNAERQRAYRERKRSNA